MANYTNNQVEAFISTREAELRKKAKTPGELRDCRSVAAMEWDAHTGRIEKSDLPKGWKDPYAKLERPLRQAGQGRKGQAQDHQGESQKVSRNVLP